MATIVRAEPMSAEAFAPFGHVLRLPAPGSVEPTIARDRVTLYGDLARIAGVDDVEFGLAVLEAREGTQEQMEQHRLSAELLFAARGAFVLTLAPPADRTPQAAHVRAFVVPEGQGCMLHTATWHWAPFPMGPRCEILVGFRAGTPVDDMVIAPVDGGALEIEWSP